MIDLLDGGDNLFKQVGNLLNPINLNNDSPPIPTMQTKCDNFNEFEAGTYHKTTNIDKK